MNPQTDHFDSLDAELMLLAVGELPPEAAERLQARLADDVALQQHYAALTDDFAWLDTALDKAEDDRPVRLNTTLRAVREQSLTQPTFDRKVADRWSWPLAGVPTWALSGAAAAAMVVGAVLFWGLRDVPGIIGPIAQQNYNANDQTMLGLSSEKTTAVQHRAEWAFGVSDMINEEPDGLAYAFGSADEMAYDLNELSDSNVIDQWLDTYR